MIGTVAMAGDSLGKSEDLPAWRQGKADKKE